MDTLRARDNLLPADEHVVRVGVVGVVGAGHGVEGAHRRRVPGVQASGSQGAAGREEGVFKFITLAAKPFPPCLSRFAAAFPVLRLS